MTLPVSPCVVDVDALMAGVRERAALRRAGMSPDGALGLVSVRPDRARSLARGAGPAITAAKRLVVRAQHHFLADLADQLSRALFDAQADRRRIARDIAELRGEITRVSSEPRG
ncbi:MAG: hypothetical protein KDC33_02620 [Thermoleophilia bacterium]|nr:hypothetical protein [Thermoleophilia bacterium]